MIVIFQCMTTMKAYTIIFLFMKTFSEKNQIRRIKKDNENHEDMLIYVFKDKEIVQQK
jgi:hypothetical protein